MITIYVGYHKEPGRLDCSSFQKMRLRHEEVIYLGHLISGGALKPSLVKFLPSLLTINETLRKLSCKDASWTWQSE